MIGFVDAAVAEAARRPPGGEGPAAAGAGEPPPGGAAEAASAAAPASEPPGGEGPRLTQSEIKARQAAERLAKAAAAISGGGRRRKTRRMGKKAKIRRTLRGGQDKFSPLAKKLMIHRHHDKTVIPLLERDFDEAQAYNRTLGERARAAATPEERAALLARQLQHAKSVHESTNTAIAEARAARQAAREEFESMGGKRKTRRHRKW